MVMKSVGIPRTLTNTYVFEIMTLPAALAVGLAAESGFAGAGSDQWNPFSLVTRGLGLGPTPTWKAVAKINAAKVEQPTHVFSAGFGGSESLIPFILFHHHAHQTKPRRIKS